PTSPLLPYTTLFRSFFLAFWFTDQFRDLVTKAEEEVSRVRPLIILTAIVAIAIYFLIQFLRRPVHSGDPNEMPLIGDQVAEWAGDRKSTRLNSSHRT